MSDSHDREDNLKKALAIFKEEGVGEIIHCGDFCAPFMIKEMAKFNGKVHCVFGNIDDEFTTTKFALEEDVNLYGVYGNFEVSGKKMGVVHFPEIGGFMAKSGEFDVVFYGHTHKNKKEEVDGCLLINPGELMGRKGTPTVAIYDTEVHSVKFRRIKNE